MWPHLYQHGDEQGQEKEGQSEDIEERERDKYLYWCKLIGRIIRIKVCQDVGHKGRQDHLYHHMTLTRAHTGQVRACVHTMKGAHVQVKE